MLIQTSKILNSSLHIHLYSRQEATARRPITKIETEKIDN